MRLDRQLKKAAGKTKKTTGPVWKGPEEDGITFSLLSRFLVCRERFRCLVVDGLRPADGFNHRIEFGQMWHTCDEALAANRDWGIDLLAYTEGLFKKYPMSRGDIANWSRIAALMFPIYVRYWQDNPDVTERTPLLQEQVFDVPYSLPSGRVVRLRGKWDSVDLIGSGKTAGIYLQENKTKSDINEAQLRRQLTFDLQTMLYLVSLEETQSVGGYKDYPNTSWDGFRDNMIKGVRYNVVKRPRHYQGKKETAEEFYNRLQGIIEKEPHEFFMRWKCEVNAGDVAKFRRECLDPLLDNLCNWWHMINHRPMAQRDWDNLLFGTHWRHPFGVYNVLDEGGSSDLDEYLTTGSEVGLARVSELFGELK